MTSRWLPRIAWPRRSLRPGWLACATHAGRSTLALVERIESVDATERVERIEANEGGEAIGGMADTAPKPRARVRWVASAGWDQPAATLRGLRRTRHWGRHRRVALLERAAYQCLPVAAPAELPRGEWAAAVRWRLIELVDFDVEQAAVDVLAVPEGVSARAQPQAIAVAAPFDRVRPLTEAGRAAGCPWSAIDVRETALRNLCAMVEPPTGAQALLHIDESHGTLVVTLGGELLMSRQFDVTESALAADTPEHAPAFDRAGLELQRTLDGLERQYTQVSLTRLLVSPMSGVEAFCDRLRELLYVPVAALDLGTALDIAEAPELAVPAVLHAHLCAIGAALRDA